MPVSWPARSPAGWGSGGSGRPSWRAAAPGLVAGSLVIAFAAALTGLAATVRAGLFAARMQVALVSDGLVMLILEV